MATTAQQVFELTIGLIDELVSGAADNANTAGYKARTVTILNNLVPKLYKYSSGVTATAGARTVPTLLTALTDAVPLDDVLCRAVLPHGLAAAYLVNDNASLASYHGQLFNEETAKLMSVPAESEDITNLYGVIGFVGGDY